MLILNLSERFQCGKHQSFKNMHNILKNEGNRHFVLIFWRTMQDYLLSSEPAKGGGTDTLPTIRGGGRDKT